MLTKKNLILLCANCVVILALLISGCQSAANQGTASTPTQVAAVSTPTPSPASPTQPQIVYRDQTYNCLSPRGIQLPVDVKPLAPRLDTLDGKTIYIVDVGFTDTHQLFTEMQKLLSEKYPKTNFVIRTKIGTYFEDDPKLWAEIKEKGAGMIMGVGH